HEVGVDRAVADRIELDVARQHAVRLAVDLHVEQGRVESGLVDLATEFLGLHRDQGRGFMVPIDHPGNAAGAAGRAGRPLTGALPKLRAEAMDFRHRLLLSQSGRWPPGVPTRPTHRSKTHQSNKLETERSSLIRCIASAISGEMES